ncbi:hypothetical protein [Zavarzinella formosa]|uniref:hypothetical protein n=1 Tax=Zavarzinella formosa TaxID=360055 RepID=UPI0003029EEC|nr:hypothetical protein [Zavarzinella formosa]
MASNLKFTTALRNARGDAITTTAGNSGFIKLYTGTQTTDANTALGAQTLLATLTLNATFAGSTSSGVLTLNAITSDTNAAATGTATWFRMLKSNGTTVVMDGSVGTSGADLNLNTTSIVSGATVACTSAVFTEGNA